MTAAEEKVESVDFSLDRTSCKVQNLFSQGEAMREEITYLQSQSMRNNLLFSNIPESLHETNEEAEKKVRGFICTR